MFIKQPMLFFIVFFLLFRVTVLVLRWFSMVVLKDLDMKINRSLEKLKTQLSKLTPLKNNKHNAKDKNKSHVD